MNPYPTTEQARATALSYLKRQLQRGNQFASLLLETLDLHNGHFEVLVANGCSGNDLVELDRGHSLGKGPSKPVTVGKVSGIAFLTPSADSELASLLSQKLAVPGGYCVLENSLAAPQDPVLQSARSRIVACGSDVYHLLLHSDSQRVSAQDVIREAHSAPTLIGASGQVADLVQYQSNRVSLSLEELRVLAISADLVFASAYDGEGYLCWLKE